MHSTNVTPNIINSIDKSIEITFANFDLSEEVRINLIFKGWKISKPKYNNNYTHFTRTYERVVSK